jgi:hypothetical protein
VKMACLHLLYVVLFKLLPLIKSFVCCPFPSCYSLSFEVVKYVFFSVIKNIRTQLSNNCECVVNNLKKLQCLQLLSILVSQ